MNETPCDNPNGPYEFKIETSEDLRLILEVVVNDVMNANADPLMRGRVIALLVNAGSRILELTDIGQRLDRLEEIAIKKDKVIVV